MFLSIGHTQQLCEHDYSDPSRSPLPSLGKHNRVPQHPGTWLQLSSFLIEENIACPWSGSTQSGNENQEEFGKETQKTIEGRRKAERESLNHLNPEDSKELLLLGAMWEVKGINSPYLSANQITQLNTEWPWLKRNRNTKSSAWRVVRPGCHISSKFWSSTSPQRPRRGGNVIRQRISLVISPAQLRGQRFRAESPLLLLWADWDPLGLVRGPLLT